MKMSFHQAQNRHIESINHYREIEEKKASEKFLSGFEPATLRSRFRHDDLWLHLQATLLASVFRLLQRPGVVVE